MAAGLGFKTFTTGEVLTADNVNGYLMQGVLVFASAAARDAAITSPQEGQCCYLKDTDAVQTYSGSAWVGFDDSNAIQNSIVDAKGDIVAASGNDTPARLAVGNNGETLVADSSTSTGLRWQGDYAAGKNKVINGDFGIWQRGTSFTTADVYTADRWVMSLSGATATTSRQSFTVGQSDVPNNPTYFLRYAASVGDNNARIMYRGEDVTTFANTATTISFYAKGTNPAGGSLALLLTQYFGSAGSAAVDTTIGSITLTASWQRFTFTFTPPSVSGKTITSGNYFALDFRQPNGDTGAAAWTLDLANVQWEVGSVATAFQTSTGTLQGELAACQRYYYRQGGDAVYQRYAQGQFTSGTNASINLQMPVTMRVTPTSLDYSTLAVYNGSVGVVAVSSAALTSDSSKNVATINATIASGGTNGSFVALLANNSTSSLLGVSAEL